MKKDALKEMVEVNGKHGGGKGKEHEAANGHGHAQGEAMKEAGAAAAANETTDAAEAPEMTAGETPVTKERKLQVAKPRDGFEPHIEPMLQLYGANHDELGQSIAVDEVRQNEADVGRLETERETHQDLANLAAGQKTLKRGSVWSSVLEIYGKADSSKKLKDDPTVAAFRSFMKLGPRKAKPEGGGGKGGGNGGGNGGGSGDGTGSGGGAAK